MRDAPPCAGDARPAAHAAGEVRLGPLGESLGFLLRLAQLASFRDYFDRLGGLGMRPGEMSVLLLIAENPGVRQGALARRLMIKRAHMTKMVRAMEEEGLVSRTVPEDDRRSIELRLTARGEARVAALRVPVLEHEAQPAERLSAAEAEELRRLLRLYLGLDAGQGARAPARTDGGAAR
jgi:DNA-binding MarR family transcriptional regulator